MTQTILAAANGVIGLAKELISTASTKTPTRGGLRRRQPPDCLQKPLETLPERHNTAFTCGRRIQCGAGHAMRLRNRIGTGVGRRASGVQRDSNLSDAVVGQWGLVSIRRAWPNAASPATVQFRLQNSLDPRKVRVALVPPF
jgi:hypothetical protein